LAVKLWLATRQMRHVAAHRHSRRKHAHHLDRFPKRFPTALGGVPWDPSFEWKFVNYTPLLVGGTFILLWIYWHVSVKKWFTGPVRQVDETGAQLGGVR
jgi:hypothetical protein